MSKIVPFIITLLLGTSLIQSCIWSMPNEDSTQQVNCYDGHGSVILDQTCEFTLYGMPFELKLVLGVGIELILILLCFLLNYGGQS